MKLDILDKKILWELETDASQSSSAIAKKLKRSKELINFRIHRLQRENVLLGCSAIVDMAKLGYFTFRIYFRWQNMTDTQKQEFYDEIKVQENVWTTTVLHGKWDFAFFVGVKSDHYINSFHAIYNKILLKYKHKIAESKIAIYAPVHNFNKRFFIDFKMATGAIERVYGEGPPIDHDEMDERIIKAYASDVRIPLTKIAATLGLSSEAVRQRIKRLEEKRVIVGYKINMNLPKMGYQGYRVDFLLNSVERNMELFQYLKQHKYFYQINRSIGGADFETEIVVESLAHLLDILEEVVNRFPDIIKAYEYFGYSEFPTLSMVPD
ncbi:Lrp/AsnC family transcriptional regulator [Candidatus Woesearchaeota archaeon]|nr:Lrp/AsnC family transcriptional regulator [Candidatus Woesearchaeota archaeon]